jgi:hypothetical protein
VRDREIRRSVSLRAAYVVCALLSVAFIASNSFVIDGHRYFGVFDDAMISMRYGSNLAHGHGLVWNVGAPPVEGYTNFLWTLWMAALHVLPVSERVAPLLVMVSGAVLLLANLRVVHLLAERLAPGTMAGVAAVWITVFSFPVLFWTLLGMEVGLVAFLLSLAVLLAVRWQQEQRPADRVWLAVVLCLSVLTRTDAVLPALVIAAYVGITADRRRRVAAVALPLVAVLATVMAHTMFRLAYYGEPLPNSY